MSEMFESMTYKQKVLFASIAIVLLIAIVFKFAIYPIFEKNTKLKQQLENQVQLSQYLQTSKQSLLSNKIFPALNPKKAQTIINAAFKSIQKNTTITGSNIALTAKSQNFSKIISSIQQLKMSNGIVVLQANITKTKEGLVDANLEFGYPL